MSPGFGCGLEPGLACPPARLPARLLLGSFWGAGLRANPSYQLLRSALPLPPQPTHLNPPTHTTTTTTATTSWPTGAGYAGGIVSSAVDGLRVGGAIAAELMGRPAQDAAAFKVKGSY